MSLHHPHVLNLIFAAEQDNYQRIIQIIRSVRSYPAQSPAQMKVSYEVRPRWSQFYPVGC